MRHASHTEDTCLRVGCGFGLPDGPIRGGDAREKNRSDKRRSNPQGHAAAHRKPKVYPEDITITDNAIIPLKERVVDEFYDPLNWLL